MLYDLFLLIMAFMAILTILGFIFWNISLHYWSPLDYTMTVSVKQKYFFDDLDLNTFNTGDILLFFGSSFGQRSLRAVLRTYYDHCAMVVKDSHGKLRLWEADIGQGCRKGARLIDLSQKLHNYKGYHFFIRIPYIGKAIDRNLLSMSIMKNQKEDIHGKIGLVKYFLSYNIFSPIISQDLFRNGRFCSELLYETLTDVGIVKPDIASRYKPADFLDINHRSLDGQKIYDDLIQLIYF